MHFTKPRVQKIFAAGSTSKAMGLTGCLEGALDLDGRTGTFVGGRARDGTGLGTADGLGVGGRVGSAVGRRVGRCVGPSDGAGDG